ncbi:hypothetical protein HanRHA438_Chr04g0156971 [Helianthus annuus]|nr:hypothetical protein HanHA300_Chr04g0120901 [Helianthus annuus]KAJ0587000.1 hypothetical protein HanIR_Chr04g0158161 [Helianthus annuus]KAJ0595605.1 hypothetical protein HanHA89_Chr04g0133181 [Helianthus annuus]KAJ0756256.1 hypothetical protein HanLR1_Chr04g0124961 [Helianthus annuus]KAJ0760037.1 hypothetical protein HanOQP8_Chr04g0133301 [Helianthus annuus]
MVQLSWFNLEIYYNPLGDVCRPIVGVLFLVLFQSKMKEAKKLVEASVRVKCSGMVVFGLNALEQLYI